jgi:PadR family transcriptional regulator, regulatory protein PadR
MVTVNARHEVEQQTVKHLLDAIVLQLLSKKSMCGYEVIMAIKKSYGVYFGASTIYPMLSSLENKKLVESRWTAGCGRPKKNYSLTVEGQKKVQFTLNRLFMPAEDLNP